jgi:hypothetical protein
MAVEKARPFARFTQDSILYLEKGRGGGLAKGQEATPRTCSVKQHGVLVYVSHLGIQVREQDRGDDLN